MASNENAELKAVIRSSFGFHPNWPKQGVTFIDFLPIMRDPVRFESLLTAFLSHIFVAVLPKAPSHSIDVVVGLDARGFLLGPVLALRLGAAFVPVRKRGKLPGETVSAEYAKEYGTDTFEMQKGAIQPGQTVIVVDDLIATAAGNLVRQLGGKVLEYLFIIELEFLKGASKLDAPTWSLLQEDD